MTRPERIVHLGLGAFFKAHQAWYTQHASDSENWGIVAYTGREPKSALELKAQSCAYTLVTRGATQDSFEVIESVVRAEPADNVADLMATLATDQIAIVTLTITEAGYLLTNEPLEKTALGRLCLALEERRKTSGAPLALVSCDNMPDNAKVLREALLSYANRVSAELMAYINSSVSFVSTSVDRITPKTLLEDYNLVEKETGFRDNAVVVTEPFRDWILQGEFPLGRPKWETAGAKFVADVSQFESRKLWLLNGAHSLMSFMGQIRGFETVDQAIANPEIRDLVETFWDEAQSLLDDPALQISDYRHALIERFENPRIGYQLSQIAQQGLTKVKVRIVPVAEALLARGAATPASLKAIGYWIAYALGGYPQLDAKSESIAKALATAEPVVELLKLVSQKLATDQKFVKEIENSLAELSFL